MNDWIEVFAAGTWTDSKGTTKTWTDEELDRIVAATRAQLGVSGREAPAVIGHPTAEAPAWGWVADIVRRGHVLLVKFRDLVPEFVEAVRLKKFPNRSVAIRADYALDHVGFLGAKAPAVLGLAPIALAQDDATAVITFTTQEESMDKTFMQKLAEFLGLAKELQIELPESALLPKPGASPNGLTATFSQADVDAATEKARAAERETGKKATALATRTAGIATFCEGLKPTGHWAPAWEKAGIVRFMVRLAELEDVVMFAEGDATTTTQTPLAWFQGFVAGLPKVVHFEEIAAPAKKSATTAVSDRQREVNRQLGMGDDVVAKFAQAS